MTVYMTGFFRCICSKMHSRGGLNYGSMCTCGRKLWNQGTDTNIATLAARIAVRKLLASRQDK